MTDARSRWSDDRLDDLALTVRTLHDLPNRMIEFEARLTGLEEDVHETRNGIQALIARQEKRDEERKQEQQRDRQEKRADRKWKVTIAVMLLCAIIAAVTTIVVSVHG